MVKFSVEKTAQVVMKSKATDGILFVGEFKPTGLYRQQKVIMLSGVPASGKTTFGKHFSKSGEYKLISRDDVRENIRETRYNTEGHKIVREAFLKEIEKELIEGNDIIVDATHLHSYSRYPVIQLCKKYGADIECVWFDLPLGIVLKQNEQRDNYVPVDTIMRMHGHYEPPTFVEGFSRIISLNELYLHNL